jgi:hypothetical protein
MSAVVEKKALMAYEITFFGSALEKRIPIESNRFGYLMKKKGWRARSVGYLTTFLSHRWAPH